jgi:hypothetical protein
LPHCFDLDVYQRLELPARERAALEAACSQGMEMLRGLE